MFFVLKNKQISGVYLYLKVEIQVTWYPCFIQVILNRANIISQRTQTVTDGVVNVIKMIVRPWSTYSNQVAFYKVKFVDHGVSAHTIILITLYHSCLLYTSDIQLGETIVFRRLCE